MGQEIVYCTRCARMLRTADFEKQHALRFEEKVYCSPCAPPEARRAPPPAGPTPPSLRAHDSSRHKAVRIAEPAPRRPRWGLITGGIVLAAAAVAAFLALATPRSAPEATAPSGPEPALAPAPTLSQQTPKEDPREKAAYGALQEARDALRANPEDLGPVVAGFERAVAAAQGTGFVSQAARELEAAVRQKRERLSAAIETLGAESRRAAGREEFKVAADLLAQAIQAARSPAVREALQAEAEERRRELVRLRESVRARATQARRLGQEKEVTEALLRAATWGDPAFVEELRQVLASVPAPPSAEAGAYRQVWLEALEAASRRDYELALRRIEEAERELKDPRMKEEAAEDGKRLRGVWDLVTAAGGAFARLEKGQKVSLEVMDLEGRPRRVEGMVTRSGPGWMAVQEEKDLAIVDREDLTAQAILDLSGSPARAGDASLLLALERCPREEGLPGLPEKYAIFSRECGPVRVLPEEREARRLFRAAYDPERDWPDGRRKGTSTAVYRRLLAEFGQTDCVRRHRDRIAARSEPPAETVLQALDLRGSGGFRLEIPEKAPCFWRLSAAPPTGSGRDTYVELDFEVGQESAWTAWAYVGACSAESLSIAWQETDLVETNAKGQKVTFEPGSPGAMAVKASIAKLPRSRSSSRPEAYVYGWIALPMPRMSPAGPKKARLLADRPGLAVKAVILSSVRTAAPSDAEARELEQVGPQTVTRGLVGWWKLDESSGPTVDRSGHRHPGTWVGHPTFTSPGAPALASSAGCLSLGGQAQYVDLADPSAFPSGASPRSLCGWGKSESTAGGYRWIASFGTPSQSQAMFIGQNGASLVGGGFGDDLWVAGLWDAQWHHVALTYDGGTARLYWDGVEKVSMRKGWNLVPGAATIGRQVGYDSEYWKGQVSDVRIYDRALTESEIRLLAEGR